MTVGSKKNLVQLKDKQYWIECDETGKPVSNEVKSVDMVVKEVPRVGFAITYISTIVNMIESIGNKKMQVVKYVLRRMDSNNKLSETTREVARGCGVSLATVQETLKLLEDCGVIARKTGTIMLSPKLAHKGNAARERYLMTKFVEIQNGGDVDVEQLKEEIRQITPSE